MVAADRVESLNLLGLMLRALVARNLADPAIARRIRGISGDVLLCADRMRVTLRLRQGEIAVLRDAAGPWRARVQGSLGALLALALGRGLVWAVLSRRVRVGGNLLLLLRLMPLLRVRDGG
jgi:ubiquinone biosynthesis protein UbiJ